MIPDMVSDWSREIDMLKARDVELSPGLDEEQLEAAEARLGFRLPPDLRSLLSAVLPRGAGFPEWHRPGSPELAAALASPIEGLCSGVGDGWWWPPWGRRPQTAPRAVGVARARLAGVPPLVPIFGHRHIPADPPLAGNPVFSVYQTDAILAGADLRDYLNREFGDARTRPHATTAVRPIRFWSELALASGGAEAWRP